MNSISCSFWPTICGPIVLEHWAMPISHAKVTLNRYLADYPKGKYADSADYLKGCFALEAGEFSKAETIFGSRLEIKSDFTLAAEMQFLLANTQFAQASDPLKKEYYKKSIENYKKYLAKNPTGKFAEECAYRIPLASFQLGDYGPALEGFQAYMEKYPSGTFAADGGYRIALCYQAANQYDEVLKRCAAWIKANEGGAMVAEVLSLQGDAYAAKEMSDEAAESYRRSVEISDSDVLLQYALFQANEQFQKKDRWDEIVTLFTRFVEQHPKHPAAVVAIYWVSKAKIKQGKSEEAKRYLADAILKNINDRNKDAVEQLLSQLAQTFEILSAEDLTTIEGQVFSNVTLRRAGALVMLKMPVPNGTGMMEMGLPLVRIAKVKFPEPPELAKATAVAAKGDAEQVLLLTEKYVSGQGEFKDIQGSWWFEMARLRLLALAA